MRPDGLHTPPGGIQSATVETSDDAVEDEYADAPLDEEEVEAGEDLGDAEPSAPEGEANVESIEDILATKDGAHEDEDPLLVMSREERLEPLAVKVEPPRATEFVCKKCYLVKHQSQLKDKKRQLCRDCA